MWSAVIVLLTVALLGSAAVVFGRDRGQEPPFLRAAAARASTRQQIIRNQDRDEVWIAGSGSCLPITQILADAFCAQQGAQSCPIVIQESVGSGGGVAATRDGAVELGVISRPMSDKERKYGLVVRPYARVAIAFAVNGAVRDRDLAWADVIAMYEGKRRKWRDGSRVVVFLREKGDSAQLIMSKAVPAYKAVNEAALRDSRFRVLYTDREMQDALVVTPGAVGIFDEGSIASQRLPVGMLRVDGLVPSAAGVADGTYPYVKPLAFVMQPSAPPLAKAFVDFATGPEGQRIIAENGYAPPAPTGSEVHP